MSTLLSATCVEGGNTVSTTDIVDALNPGVSFTLQRSTNITCTFDNGVERRGIDLVKTGSLDMGADGMATVGDIISYTFEATNTGNVALSGITLSDTVGGVTILGGLTIATLGPGASEATTSTGQVCDSGTTCATGDETVTIDQVEALVRTKTGTLDLGGDFNATPGDAISYTFTIENTGDIDLTSVDVTDIVTGVHILGGPIASLVVGAQTQAHSQKLPDHPDRY